MDSGILFFFDEHMSALPIYERLENAILTRMFDSSFYTKYQAEKC